MSEKPMSEFFFQIFHLTGKSLLRNIKRICRTRYASLSQNLKDAGIDTGAIKKFLSLEEANRTAEQLKLLAKHREILLKTYHEDQKKIDCLDFLIFNLRQRKETESKEMKGSKK